MNNNNTITIQEVRRDLPGFLQRIADGATLTVISHSKPVVTLASSRSQVDSEAKGMQHFLDLAAEARKTAKGTLDPNKSIKQLYAETIGEKYGIR